MDRKVSEKSKNKMLSNHRLQLLCKKDLKICNVGSLKYIYKDAK
jgi:hypothetical protein